MNVYVLDFETYWDSASYTLSKMGPVEYIRDPRFDVQLLGYAHNLEPPVVLSDRVAIRDFLYSIDYNDSLIVGHNMSGFDALILSEHYGLHPRHVLDTICLARWVGYSSICRENLESLAQRLGIGTKEPGTMTSNGKVWPVDFTPEEQAYFIRYCGEDVRMCRDMLRMFMPYITADVIKFISLTTRMATEPVFEVNGQELIKFGAELDRSVQETQERLVRVFHFDNTESFLKTLRSKEKFAALLRSQGVEPPQKLSQSTGKMIYAFAKSDVPFLSLLDHPNDNVRDLVEARLEHNSSILKSRCETLLKFADMHKPMPIILSAFKARTGRYSAGATEGTRTDAIQVQNLSKRNPKHLGLRRAIHAPEGYTIVSCDSSQVEARVLAWFAREEQLLEAFRQKRDPYAEFGVHLITGLSAEDIHDGAKAGDEQCKFIRNLSKKFILSAGYGVGQRRVAESLWMDGIRLSPDYEKHAQTAAEHLAVYRAQHPNIVRVWRLCDIVLEDLMAGGSGYFGGPTGQLMQYGYYPIAGGPAVQTVISPSGYHLRYPTMSMTTNAEGKPVKTYRTISGGNTIYPRIYGGKLTENIIQHLAFMILAWQACRIQEAGVELKCNIHDAWVAVVPVSQASEVARVMEQVMRYVPEWAEGLPLDAEAKIGNTFEIV